MRGGGRSLAYQHPENLLPGMDNQVQIHHQIFNHSDHQQHEQPFAWDGQPGSPELCSFLILIKILFILTMTMLKHKHLRLILTSPIPENRLYDHVLGVSEILAWPLARIRRLCLS